MGPLNSTRNAAQSLVTFPNIIAQCLFTCATSADGLRGLCQVTANKLTDDALLDIFDFYLNDNTPDRCPNVGGWHTLVHVCRRWRNLVFASPRRLNLGLFCSKRRPVRAMLDIWPALPIVIQDDWTRTRDVGRDLDNVVAALEHPDRVCSINLSNIPRSEGEALAAAMQVPFPELTYPRLGSGGRSAPILCNSFLGGSAPRLYALWLIGISFLAIPNLLLSASNLVSLALWRVPHSGYISPEAMAACLSSLNRLECLHLRFKSPQPRPDQPSPPPRTRVVLPVLTTLIFKGMTDYSEDFLARIDTPVLDQLFMTFFLDLGFDVPHLKEFIGRANRLKLPKEASVVFASRSIALQLDRHRHRQHRSSLDILDPRCDRIGWQVDSMALLCGQLSPFFSLIEQLDFIVYCPPSKPLGEDDIQSTQLLELFRPFTAVRSLHVSRSLVPLVATALQVLDGPRATEVLPKLRYLYYGRSAMPATVPEGMQSFVTARQLSGQAVAVRHWEGLEADW